MTLEALFAQIAAEGLQVNGLFQRADGRWQCNLRRPGVDLPAGWSHGHTVTQALVGALDNALAVKPRQRPADARQMPLPLTEGGVFA